MTVLVTGATGFIGKELATYLSRTRPGQRIIGTARHAHPSVIPIYPCDFLNRRQTHAFIKRTKPHLIFHCVGTTAPGPWSRLYSAHVVTTANLLEACSRLTPKPKIVLLGSAAEYGQVARSRQPIRETEPRHPESLYGLSKHYQAMLAVALAQNTIPIVIGRLFNILAPNQPAHFSLGRFQQLIRHSRRRKQGVQRLGLLNAIRDYLSLKEVCAALVALGSGGKAGETYNICSGVPLRMEQILKEMMRFSGVSFRYVQGRDRSSPRSTILRCVGDPRKMRRQTGWRSTMNWKDAVQAMMNEERYK